MVSTVTELVADEDELVVDSVDVVETVEEEEEEEEEEALVVGVVSADEEVET